MKNVFLDLLQSAVEKVKKMNQADPNVKTADSSVFDAIKNRVQKAEAKPHVNTEVEYCEDICEEIEQVKVENEADPQIETADASVFEQMKKEIEALKAQVATQQTEKAEASTVFVERPSAPSGPSSTSTSNEIMAMTNSVGGSLALRAEPNMGAATNSVRVPDSSLVRIIEYSENSIHLDGKQTRFVLIQFGDQQGWLLESYLNFN